MTPLMGSPPAMPLAKEAASGRMPYCWKANSVPVGPHRLDLVRQQQPVPLLAERLQRLHILRLQRQHAALSLHQLHQHGADVVACGGLQRGEVVGVGIPEALGEGEEVLVENIVRWLWGGDGAAVEGIFQGDDGGAALAVFSKLYFRASLISPSLASPPPLAKNTQLVPVRLQRVSARRAAGSV